jgi:probable HAF family extracellular repeat protein
VAEGINNRGDIVGLYSTDGGDSTHGFIFRGGVYTTIDVPFTGATNTQIFSINATGQIAGRYDDENGITHGFVGTPLRQ